ncbi:acylphosphatase [Candidatus Kaiserbacteria bacterium]|nr:acylphosphatase [Candidatus Kaiserbacteria bacterium]
MVELRAVIHGRVQGVSFRAYIQDAATELGLVGIVQNKTDGTVRVVAQGMPEDLKTFVEYLHEGSLLAVVEGVAVEWGNVNKTFTDFSVLH